MAALKKLCALMATPTLGELQQKIEKLCASKHHPTNPMPHLLENWEAKTVPMLATTRSSV
jgi:hypothetical protein